MAPEKVEATTETWFELSVDGVTITPVKAMVNAFAWSMWIFQYAGGISDSWPKVVFHASPKLGFQGAA